jgi:hypothetical protein
MEAIRIEKKDSSLLDTLKEYLRILVFLSTFVSP